jgi:hypothetical protein
MRMIGCRLSIPVLGTALQPADLYSVEAKTASGGTASPIWISPANARAAEHLSLKVWNRTAVCGRMHNFVMG